MAWPSPEPNGWMDPSTVIFWFVCVSCISSVVVTLPRIKGGGMGWVALYLTILAVLLAGGLLEANTLIYVAAVMWLVLAFTPGLISLRYYRRLFEQNYSAAYQLSKILSWLHPLDGWREQPEIMRALILAQQGKLSGALEILEKFRDNKSAIGVAAVANLYRITNQWEEFLHWEREHQEAIGRHPQLLPTLLRARGETGDWRGLVELYRSRQPEIARLAPAATRDLCRLVLFAFCGKPGYAERLFAGSLQILPANIKEFWLATAELANGAQESAQDRFQMLLPAAEPPLRLAIERRLNPLLIPPIPLDPSMEGFIASVALEVGQEQSLGARPSLFSKQARATQILLALNVSTFAAEVFLGGGSNPETLYRLGALFPPAVRAGEWWRLLTSFFLHFGALHLVMNMLGLWLLGPFVEFALGFARYVFLYLLAGIGSMCSVMVFGWGSGGDHLTVGASGCVMGLVGATGALMLRGWLRHRALSAKRRFSSVLLIITMQSLFDLLVPEVSMTAHLSGALIGFAIASIVGDRLKLSAS